jgi:hypothetical protein
MRSDRVEPAGRTRLLLGLSVLGIGLAGFLALPSAAGAADPDPDEVITFAKHVSRILQANCETCHRPGSIGPMSLITYQEVRRYATRIRDRVESRVMPPWPLDRTVGIQEFKNDMSLSDEEVSTIVRWVNEGAAEGDPADMPPAIVWPDYANSWMLAPRYGQPDIVITTEDYTVPAEGLDQWFESEVPIPDGLVGAQRWIRAVEIRPSTPDAAYVFHHGNSNLRQASEDGTSEGTALIGAAVGKMYDILPPDAGLKLYPGATVSTEIHYFPVGREVEHATMDIGIYLYPAGEVPRFETEGSSTVFADGTFRSNGAWAKIPAIDASGVRAVDIFIPPNSTQMLQGRWVVQQPTRIHSIRGHLHLRGKYQIIEAIYPDGRQEVINKLNWEHRWHTDFVYEDDVAPLLPRGTIVILTSYYDNTAANPANPDPDQLVVFGRRSVDEMSHFWIGRTYFTDEEFAELVAERERMLAQRPVAQEE